MAKFTTLPITTNVDTLVCTVVKKRDLTEWTATIAAYGTWGGGTITWKFSPDGGTTRLSCKDLTGTVVTSTADDNFTVTLGMGGTLSDNILFYASMAGSSGASVTAAVFDNN